MKRLITSKIILGTLLAATIFCSLERREAKAVPPPATTSAEAPTCPCEKPEMIDEPIGSSGNIVVRMLEIY